MKSMVDHPDHYQAGGFECIDVMLAVFGVDAVKSFCLLNAFKYLYRSEKKNGIEDLKKASWYLNKIFELVKKSLFDNIVSRRIKSRYYKIRELRQ